MTDRTDKRLRRMTFHGTGDFASRGRRGGIGTAATTAPSCGVLILLIASAVFLPAGCGGKAAAAENAPTEEAASAPSSIMAFGKVVASDQFVAHAPWDGRVVDILVWEGKRVLLGDTLAAFDPEDRLLALDTARLIAGAARSSAAEAGSELAAAEVALAEVKGRLERIRRLVDGGSVSEQELEAVQAEYGALVYERDAASWALGARRDEAERAEAAYTRLENLSREAFYSENLLICPLEEAVVTEIHVQDGTVMEIGDQMLVLHDASALVVEADLPEEFVRDVSSGSEVEVIPVADPDRRYRGVVTELAGLARLINGENVVKIRVKLEEVDDFLREGFNVDVEIPIE